MNSIATRLFLGSGVVAVFALVYHVINRKINKAVLDTPKRESKALETYKKIKNSSAADWQKVGSVKELWIYPLKSGKGQLLESCFFDTSGMVLQQGHATLKDRLIVAYNEETKRFATARQYPKLMLVEAVTVNQTTLGLRVEGMPDLEFKVPKLGDETRDSLVMWFGETVECLNCGPEANKWISNFLLGKDSGCRLGLSSPDSRRVTTIGAWEKHARLYENLRDKDTGLFSDLASYMLLSQSSVDDLNNRLGEPIEPLQLRPNIVVKGCKPYAEDNWEYIKFGDEAIIRQFKNVPRCTMVNVNPETGERAVCGEPLATMKTYRIVEDPKIKELEKNAPCFGIYCGSIAKGYVKINDDVYVYWPKKKLSLTKSFFNIF